MYPVKLSVWQGESSRHTLVALAAKTAFGSLLLTRRQRAGVPWQPPLSHPGSSMAERLPVKEGVAGSSPARGASESVLATALRNMDPQWMSVVRGGDGVN